MPAAATSDTQQLLSPRRGEAAAPLAALQSPPSQRLAKAESAETVMSMAAAVQLAPRLSAVEVLVLLLLWIMGALTFAMLLWARVAAAPAQARV